MDTEYILKLENCVNSRPYADLCKHLRRCAKTNQTSILMLPTISQAQLSQCSISKGCIQSPLTLRQQLYKPQLENCSSISYSCSNQFQSLDVDISSLQHSQLSCPEITKAQCIPSMVPVVRNRYIYTGRFWPSLGDVSAEESVRRSSSRPPMNSSHRLQVVTTQDC